MEIDFSAEAISYMTCNTKGRRGLVTERDGKYFFREGKKGTPIKIGNYTTDGYDYVYEYYGRLYITHNLAETVMNLFRFDVPFEEEKTLSEIKAKYLAYLETL